METSWTVELTPQARNQLDALPDAVRPEILAEILALEDDPLPAGCLQLRGFRGQYRIRVGRGRYRAIYRLLRERKTVLVTAVRERRDAYAGYLR